MRASLLSVLLVLVLTVGAAAAPQAPPPCEPIPGLEAEDIAKARFLIFGETHGTAEIPAFVGEAVCVLSGKRPVVLALELDEAEQASADAFLNTSGANSDVGRLLQTGAWSRPEQWGVTSVAMFKLLDQMRVLRRQGRDITVVYFKPLNLSDLNQDYYEVRMAALLAQAAEQHTNALVVGLVGNIHARKTAITLGSSTKILPAVTHLPRHDVLTFNAITAGGSAWQCRDEGCGDYKFPPGKPKAKGLYRTPGAAAAFDGQFSVGVPFTASPPAATQLKSP